ncbi:hypothetical protein KW790_00440 [Candidatus Parcubacteria bacterium]|nr:hypothetical protein [Candidatus Parcubacteria bacterium]
MKYTIPLVSLGLGILLLIFFAPNAQSTVNAEDMKVNMVSVTRADIEGSDDETPVVLVSAKNVATLDDLHAYALTALKADQKLNSMVFYDGEVSVTYPAHGRALGLVPVDIQVEATVDSQGNISIKYPWYRFSISAETGNLETNLKSEIQDATLGIGSEDAGAPSHMAALASRVYSVLRKNFESVESSNGSDSSVSPSPVQNATLQVE